MNIKKNKENRIWVEFSLSDYRDYRFLQNNKHASYISEKRKNKSRVLTLEDYTLLVDMMNSKRAEIKAAEKVELSSVNVSSQSSESRV